MAGGRTTALRTDEALWRQIVREVTAEDKGGRAGQWSARKAQICVARYKQAGGGYIGAKSPDNSLAKWTREKWRTKSGAPSLQTGERYLPSAAIEALTDEEYAETSRAKRLGMKRGQQFVPQPIEVAAKVAPYRKPSSRARDACLPSDLLLRKVSLLNKPERQNMARKYRRNNPYMGATYEAYDPYNQSASEFAAAQQQQSQSAYAAEQERQAAQERSMAEYMGEENAMTVTQIRQQLAQARQQEADRQSAYEQNQRDTRRAQELGKQDAIAAAWRAAASDAIATKRGQMISQAVAGLPLQRTASMPSYSGAKVSAPSVSFAQRSPMIPKVGGGMKGRNRNPATLTNDDFLLGRIGSSPAILCKRPAIDRKGQSKHLCAILHPDDHTAFRVEVFGRGDYATMAPHMAEAPIALSNPVNKSAFTVALRRFKQQCEALVGGAAARANNPGHESGFWDQYGGDSAYANRHAILKKALKGEWKPVSRTEVMREVRDSRGYVDENRLRRLLASYAAKVKSLADRCMRAEHSGQPFPVLEAKYEAAQLDLEDVQALVQELTEGRTRNPRVHHAADFDDLAGGTVVMRPVRKGPAVRRDREDIVAELVAIGSKRNRSASRAMSERSRSRVR